MPAGTVIPDRLQMIGGLLQQGDATRSWLGTQEQLHGECSGTLLNAQARC